MGWKEHSLFVVDTPGDADFVGDAVCALRVSDAAVVVVDALAGVDVGTLRVWRLADQRSLPRAVFINKLDKENADYAKCLEAVKRSLGPACVPVTLPVGRQAGLSGVAEVLSGAGMDRLDEDVKALAAGLREKLTEAAAETDDALTEKYLESGTLDPEEVGRALRRAVNAGTLVPVFCGSADKEIGVAELLDGIVGLFPSPADRGPVKSADGGTVEPRPDAPFSAFVFKNITDPFVGQLTYFRVYAGTLRANSSFLNATQKKPERFGHLYLIKGKEQISVDEVGPGDIVAVPKLKLTGVGNSISSEEHPVEFEPLWLPKTVISFAVHAKKAGEEEKIAAGLHRLMQEDPTLRAARNVETKEFIVSGMGDVHISTAQQRLKNKFNVDVELRLPTVPYKETIKSSAEGHERHKKQTGGRGQFADTWLEVSPRPRGEGFEFVDKIVGGAIPRNFIPAVEKGVRAAMTEGILAGYPVVDVEVKLYDGKHHPVDSSDMAFQIAGSVGFKAAVEKAQPVLLEPIMNVEITVPEESVGDIIGDLNSRRGRVLGTTPRGHTNVITAEVPLAEMLSYAPDLTSMTGGRGDYTMEFLRYEEVPAHLTPKVVAEAKKEREEAQKN